MEGSISTFNAISQHLIIGFWMSISRGIDQQISLNKFGFLWTRGILEACKMGFLFGMILFLIGGVVFRNYTPYQRYLFVFHISRWKLRSPVIKKAQSGWIGRLYFLHDRKDMVVVFNNHIAICLCFCSFINGCFFRVISFIIAVFKGKYRIIWYLVTG